jgi:hypothetical protein
MTSDLPMVACSLLFMLALRGALAGLGSVGAAVFTGFMGFMVLMAGSCAGLLVGVLLLPGVAGFHIVRSFRVKLGENSFLRKHFGCQLSGRGTATREAGLAQIWSVGKSSSRMPQTKCAM